MPNPVLTEDKFKQARAEESAGWAAPTADAALAAPGLPTRAPAGTDRMTMSGTLTATGVLFVLLLAAGAFGWQSVSVPGDGTIQVPGWIFLPMLAGLGLVIATAFKPKIVRITAPLYAICQGLMLGAISRVYDEQWDGIVIQAVGATIAVFAVMLFLYATRIVKVTDRTRRMIIGATLGVCLLYLVSFVFSIFGATPSFITSPSLLGIGFSVLVCGIAAFNLMLDFDMIEKGTAQGAPKWFEWYAAFGLMVTLIWLYLEILRLLAKLRER